LGLVPRDVQEQMRREIERMIASRDKVVTKQEIDSYRDTLVRQYFENEGKDAERRREILQRNRATLDQAFPALKPGLKGGAPMGHGYGHTHNKNIPPTYATSDSPPSSDQEDSSSSSDSSDASDSSSSRRGRKKRQADQIAIIFSEIFSDYKFPSVTTPNDVPIRPVTTVLSSLTLGCLMSQEAERKHTSHHTPASYADAFYSVDGMHCLSSHPRYPIPSRLPKGIDAGTILKTLVLHPPHTFIPMNFYPYPPTLKACDVRLSQVYSSIPLLHTPLAPRPINDLVSPSVPASLVEKMLADFESYSAASYNRAVGTIDLIAGNDLVGATKYLTDIAITSMDKCRDVRMKRIAIVTNMPEVNNIMPNGEEHAFINPDMLRNINQNLKERGDFGLHQSKAASSSTALSLPSPSSSPLSTSPFPSSSPSPSSAAPALPTFPQGDLAQEIARNLIQKTFNKSRRRGGNDKDSRGGGKDGAREKKDNGGKIFSKRRDKSANTSKNTNSLLPTPPGGGI
jgi:hypothetical protein